MVLALALMVVLEDRLTVVFGFNFKLCFSEITEGRGVADIELLTLCLVEFDNGVVCNLAIFLFNWENQYHVIPLSVFFKHVP